MGNFWSYYTDGVSAVGVGPWLTAMVATLCLIVFMGWMLRTGRIHERYALPYVALGFVMCLAVLAPSLVITAASWLGFTAPSNLLYFVCLVGLSAVCIHLTAECTNLREQNRDLIEDHALLEQRVRRLEKLAGPDTHVVTFSDESVTLPGHSSGDQHAEAEGSLPPRPTPTQTAPTQTIPKPRATEGPTEDTASLRR